jgi:hypothetical protein
MPSSGMLHRVVLVRTDVSEERITYIIMVTRNPDDESDTLLQIIGSYKRHTA